MLDEWFFKSCGPLAEQLNTDVARMGLSEEYINSLSHGWALPMSYGFQDGRYFAAEPAERRNGWVTLFDSADSEEFRWYILQHIGSGWGQRCARTYEAELMKEWEDSDYGYEYDWRKAWLEYEIDSLRRIYETDNERMQQLISSYEKLLGTTIDNNTKVEWKYDLDSRKFVSNIILRV